MSPTISSIDSNPIQNVYNSLAPPVLQFFFRQVKDGNEEVDTHDDSSECIEGCLTKWMIIFGVILVAEGFFFSHIIYALKGLRKFNRFSFLTSCSMKSLLHLGNSFSAGIFLSTGVIHLFPEVVELFSDTHSDEEGIGENRNTGSGEEGTRFPWAYFAVVVAFYAMFGIEKILIPRLIRSSIVGNKPYTEIVSDEAEMPRSDEAELLTDDSSEEQEDQTLSSAAFTRGVINVLALSVHSLFESMAIGLASNFTSMLNIFIALAAHRWATAISITFNLAWSLNYIAFLVLFLVFTITTPIGIAIGAALTSLDEDLHGVFFAISAATFIYIGAYSAPAKEFVQYPNEVVKKYLTMLAGFGVISLITWGLVAGDVHG